MSQNQWTPQPGDLVRVVQQKVSGFAWRSTVQEDGSYKGQKDVDRGQATVELLQAAEPVTDAEYFRQYALRLQQQIDEIKRVEARLEEYAKQAMLDGDGDRWTAYAESATQIRTALNKTT